MANGNANLHRAKREKNDEFFTQYSDIEKELVHYKDFFNGKTVYCNCDTIASNFMKFFDDKFDEYGLKKLIVTGLKSKGGIIYQRTKNSVYVGDLKGDGRFQSEECIEFLKECDVVVTNPPFSLFREYVALLMQYNKKFLIIGNMNATTNKDFFPYIKDNKIWLGQNAKGGTRKGNSMVFVSDNGEEKDISSWWYTNIDCQRHNTPLDLYKHYNPEEYPKYDNYDAIEVGRSCEIPMDYDGVMGVPISFLMFHCPTQFEIIWQASGNTRACAPKDVLKQLAYRQHREDRGGCGVVNGKRCYSRIFIKKLA